MSENDAQLARMDEQLKALAARVDKIENSNRWVITSVLAGVFSVVANKLGIGQ